MRFSLLSGAIFFALPCVCQAVESIRACGGNSHWPPMSYVLEDTKAVKGISVEVLKAIFNPQPEIKLRPWARCMAEVEAMQGSDVMMSTFKTSEREQKFYFSHSYYHLTPAYFYSRQKFLVPPIKQLSDLSKYKVCSLHGAATSYVGNTALKIESGATNYLSLIRKIDRGYCEIVIDMREVLFGLSKIGIASFDAAHYQILPLPETQPLPLHFAVSKKNPNALKILNELNQGIIQLEKSGKLKLLINADL
jgi:ABC-type amino acid transport substrate-binding protein